MDTMQIAGLWSKLKTQFYLFTEKWGLIQEPTEEAYERYNFSIHNLEEQMFLKRLWSICAIEELSEFAHAFEDGEDHVKEEACDFFNFMMSGFIAMGLNPEGLPVVELDFKTNWRAAYNNPRAVFMTERDLWELTDAIHYALNKLKNRPWTQANFKVDLGKFTPRIIKVWNLSWDFIQRVFSSWEDFEEHFNAKIDTNIARINTGY